MQLDLFAGPDQDVVATRPDDPPMVRCTECHAIKPSADFSPNTFRISGIQSYCRDCGMNRGRIGRGVDPAVSRLRPAVGEVCAICEQPGKLFLDHDHVTGRMRGWLCNGCNMGLGAFGDNRENLLRAAQYLKPVI